MKKIILVILDGLEYGVARDCMGYLAAMIKANRGKLYHIKSELPSISRPLYECILTGTPPAKSGVVNNDSIAPSKQKSIFHYVKNSGLKAGAASYYWISELYNKSPFDKVLDRHVEDESLTIPYAHFYYQDSYPDSHVFGDGEALRLKYNLDFLLIHSMNIDDTGHKFGHDSKEYRNQVRQTDILISNYLERWLNDGYSVMITSDHGMNDDGSHGGILDIETDVPLFVFGSAFSFINKDILQREICANICKALSMPSDKEANSVISEQTDG